MAAPISTYRKEYCAIAIEVLSQGKSIAAVCAKLKISRPTFYTWRNNNPEFDDAISLGLQQAQAAWEEIGLDGIMGRIERFSGAPWIFTMKNRFRDDYAEDKKDDKKSDEKSVLEKIISGEIVINKPVSQ
jgi:predicted DNA-binding transcriptional regulator AlpA